MAAKVSVQKLIFPKGIVINPLEREYRTSDLNPIFRLIHSFTGDDGGIKEKRTGRNTDPSRLVAGTGTQPYNCLISGNYNKIMNFILNTA